MQSSPQLLQTDQVCFVNIEVKKKKSNKTKREKVLCMVMEGVTSPSAHFSCCTVKSE